MLLLTVFLIVINTAEVVCGTRETGEYRLYKDLIEINNKYERPVYNKSDKVTIEFDFHLRLVSHFDESRQQLLCAGFFFMNWEDEFLKWDPSLYNNTTFIRPPSDYVWTPDIVASNSFQPIDSLGGDFVSLKLYSNGVVEWSPGDLFNIPCDVDVKRYPFDTLECYLELAVWDHSESEVLLSAKQETAGIAQFKSTGQWSLLSSSVSHKPIRVSGQTVSRVIITIQLDRSSTNFVFSFILPVLILSLLGTFVFLIPSDSGEKISFAITIPLSYGVYMGFLTSMVPQTSEGISVFLIFIGLTLSLSAIFVILSIFSVRICSRCEKTHPIPKRYIAFTTWIETIKDCRKRKQILDQSSFDDSIQPEPTKVHAEGMTWKRVSRAFDLLFLWVFCGPLMFSILLVILLVLV